MGGGARLGAQLVMAAVVESPPGRGGKREGAGRKPKGAVAGMPHQRRPHLDRRHPVHVTVRMRQGVKYLRGFKTYPVVRRAICAASDRLGMRIAQYSVQGNHVHLIVEVRDQIALGRAMRGLGIRLARRLNRVAGRKGKVLDDRYHAHYLKSPSEVRSALVYVLQNGAKHRGGERSRSARVWFDPFSSAAYFTGWSSACRRWVPARDAPSHPLHIDPESGRPVVPPRSWLLAEGWKRAGGPIEAWERPRS
jgi:REP element-mobilizing transposase RayT